MPLQKKFEEVQRKNYQKLKQPVDTSMMKEFAQEKVSKIKEMLNYGNLDRKSLLKMFDVNA